MSQQVAWAIELAVKGGQAEAAKAMAAELADATKSDEPGALQYQWHFDESGSQAYLYERYTDAAAAQTHLDNFGPKADRFGELFDFTKVTILSDLPADMREALAGLSPEYRAQTSGFVR